MADNIFLTLDYNKRKQFTDFVIFHSEVMRLCQMSHVGQESGRV